MSSATSVASPPSPRILAAVGLLNPQRGERLLEVGCGTGHAILAVLQRQPTARVAAVDRSGKAIARARAVNAAALQTGQLSLAVCDVESGQLPREVFDRAFCIRVNSFWTRPGVALPNLAACLRRGGELWMIYDEPAEKVVTPIKESLEEFGLRDVREEAAPGAFGIVARWPSGQS